MLPRSSGQSLCPHKDTWRLAQARPSPLSPPGAREGNTLQGDLLLAPYPHSPGW